MKTYGENSIELLNASIEDFYSFNLDFINRNKVIEFKAMFATFMNQLERVFVGVFGKVFRIETDDEIELFKNIFPKMYDIIAKGNVKEGIEKLCLILSNFRNLNAHALCLYDYKNDFDAGYILKELPNYSAEVEYLSPDGVPTIAGMITLLFFLSNDRSIHYFIKSEIWNGFIERLNYFEEDYVPNLYKFTERTFGVNKINDEYEIRSDSHCKELLQSIFGRFFTKVNFDGITYSYNNGHDEEDASFNIEMSISDYGNNTADITIKNKSYYWFYFRGDYSIRIFDVNSFIEWSNKVPPLMFLIFLYRLGVNEYRESTLSEKEKEFVVKLNKPKFYVDKSIDTLLLPDNVSDIRMGGQVVSNGINYCLYMFENMMYTRNKLEFTKYSSFKFALKYLNINEKLIDEMVGIRNFFSHYHIIGEETMVGRKPAMIDFNFVVKSFGKFIEQLELIDPFKAKQVSNDFFYRVICNLLLFKYSDVCKKSLMFMNNPRTELLVSLNKTLGRIEHSFFNTGSENLVKDVFGNRPFDYKKFKITHFHKTIIKSDKPIHFKNGFEFDGEIVLLTPLELTPKFLVQSANRLKLSDNVRGFIIEDIWQIVRD